MALIHKSINATLRTQPERRTPPSLLVDCEYLRHLSGCHIAELYLTMRRSAEPFVPGLPSPLLFPVGIFGRVPRKERKELTPICSKTRRRLPVAACKGGKTTDASFRAPNPCISIFQPNPFPGDSTSSGEMDANILETGRAGVVRSSDPETGLSAEPTDGVSER
jgi:hypothetical protein